MNDWTPLPRPSEEQIDGAASDLLHIAELERLAARIRDLTSEEVAA